MIILFIILLIVVGLIVVIALRPNTFAVERNVAISAPPALLFGQINDFHKWIAWSPFEKFDPALKRTYEGPPAGVGSVYGWSGNRRAGEGRATITTSEANQRVEMRLDFIRPFAATNTASFTFQANGGQTVVTWRMTGKCNFMSKAFGLLMNTDKMCGDMFSEGLANLQRVVAEAQRPGS
jgi:hypothetical protein